MYDTTKAELRGSYKLNACNRSKKAPQISDLNFNLKKQKKGRENKMLRREVKEESLKWKTETIVLVSINETKSWLLKKMSKIDNPLIRLIRKK